MKYYLFYFITSAFCLHFGPPYRFVLLCYGAHIIRQLLFWMMIIINFFWFYMLLTLTHPLWFFYWSTLRLIFFSWRLSVTQFILYLLEGTSEKCTYPACSLLTLTNYLIHFTCGVIFCKLICFCLLLLFLRVYIWLLVFLFLLLLLRRSVHRSRLGWSITNAIINDSVVFIVLAFISIIQNIIFKCFIFQHLIIHLLSLLVPLFLHFLSQQLIYQLSTLLFLFFFWQLNHVCICVLFFIFVRFFLLWTLISSLVRLMVSKCRSLIYIFIKVFLFFILISVFEMFLFLLT